MSNNRLNIVDVSAPIPPSKSNRRAETEARFERMWKEDPQQFDPMRQAMGRERIARTQGLIDEFIPSHDKETADLGCGSGVLAKWIAQKGGRVLAVDVAPTAVELLKDQNTPNLTVRQDFLPKTLLQDDAYNLVLCTDVVAYLHHNQYRLLFSELSRLVHAQGYVVCSTPIDIHSDDALQRFGDLAETEFTIIKWCFSHHALYIHIQELLSIPNHYARSWQELPYRNRESDRRHGLSRWWFRLNTSRPVGWIWALLKYPVQPLLNAYMQNRTVLLQLEKWCQFFWTDAGISHALFIAKRRPLMDPKPQEAIPQERKHKREVWE